MNPADRMYSRSLDDINPPTDARRCELCGALASGCEHEHMTSKEMLRAMERVYRLSEWAMWCGLSHKALGAMMRVICAKVINPTASTAQIAAAVGMSKPGVYSAMMRIKTALPQWYAALWKRGDSE